MKRTVKHYEHDRKQDITDALNSLSAFRLKELLRTCRIGIPKLKWQMVKRLQDQAHIKAETEIKLTIGPIDPPPAKQKARRRR